MQPINLAERRDPGQVSAVVRAGNTVRIAGRQYGPGDAVLLTADEAARLRTAGAIVDPDNPAAPGLPRPPRLRDDATQRRVEPEPPTPRTVATWPHD